MNDITIIYDFITPTGTVGRKTLIKKWSDNKNYAEQMLKDDSYLYVHCIYKIGNDIHIERAMNTVTGEIEKKREMICLYD